MDEGALLCTVAPYLLSDLPLTIYKVNVQYKATVCRCGVWGWGGWGGVLSCVVDHILQKFNTLFLTRFRTYKIAKSPKTKMTSKDNI